MSGGRLSSLDMICDRLSHINEQSRSTVNHVLQPPENVRSFERGQFIALLTWLQFEHPQLVHVMDEIKSLHPGCHHKEYPAHILAQLRSVLDPYTPMEVSYVELSPGLTKHTQSRVTSYDPEFPIAGLRVGIYRMVAESLSDIDESIVVGKAHAHDQGIDRCLITSLGILRMSPATSKTHRKSRSLTMVASLVRTLHL